VKKKKQKIFMHSSSRSKENRKIVQDVSKGGWDLRQFSGRSVSALTNLAAEDALCMTRIDPQLTPMASQTSPRLAVSG
jgi:hypothetical protein